MTIEYLKKAAKTPATGEDETRETVAAMLSEIEAGGEDKAREYGQKLDGWSGDIVTGKDAIAAAAEKVSDQLKDDLRFAYDRVRGFAEKQKNSLGEFEIELSPGLWAGQRLIPMEAKIARGDDFPRGGRPLDARPGRSLHRGRGAHGWGPQSRSTRRPRGGARAHAERHPEDSWTDLLRVGSLPSFGSF